MANDAPREQGVTTPPADDERFCPDCFAGMESSEHHEKCVLPTEIIEDCAALLGEIFTPAGALIFWSARIKYLNDRRPCDLWRDRDIDGLRTLVMRLNALADGAFA